MGVHGLWTLLEPVGRRVDIEAISNKRLAVDASIWLFQFMRAMRDERGEMIRNAHLLGFFRRICRLLFHKVQPIFVFEGTTPGLKRATTAARRARREVHSAALKRAAEKLLVNQIKQQALLEARCQKRQQTGQDVKQLEGIDAKQQAVETSRSPKRQKVAPGGAAAAAAAAAQGNQPAPLGVGGSAAALGSGQSSAAGGLHEQAGYGQSATAAAAASAGPSSSKAPEVQATLTEDQLEELQLAAALEASAAEAADPKGKRPAAAAAAQGLGGLPDHVVKQLQQRQRQQHGTASEEGGVATVGAVRTDNRAAAQIDADAVLAMQLDEQLNRRKQDNEIRNGSVASSRDSSKAIAVQDRQDVDDDMSADSADNSDMLPQGRRKSRKQQQQQHRQRRGQPAQQQTQQGLLRKIASKRAAQQWRQQQLNTGANAEQDPVWEPNDDADAGENLGVLGLNNVAGSSDNDSSSDEGDEGFLLPADISSLDPAVLSTLPQSVQLDILEKMRDAQQAANREKFLAAAADAPMNFSKVQMETYLTASKFRQTIEKHKKAIGGGIQGAQQAGDALQGRHMASEHTREFIFARQPQLQGAAGGAGHPAANNCNSVSGGGSLPLSSAASPSGRNLNSKLGSIWFSRSPQRGKKKRKVERMLDELRANDKVQFSNGFTPGVALEAGLQGIKGLAAFSCVLKQWGQQQQQQQGGAEDSKQNAAAAATAMNGTLIVQSHGSGSEVSLVKVEADAAALAFQPGNFSMPTPAAPSAAVAVTTSAGTAMAAGSAASAPAAVFDAAAVTASKQAGAAAAAAAAATPTGSLLATSPVPVTLQPNKVPTSLANTRGNGNVPAVSCVPAVAGSPAIDELDEQLFGGLLGSSSEDGDQLFTQPTSHAAGDLHLGSLPASAATASALASAETATAAAAAAPDGAPDDDDWEDVEPMIEPPSAVAAIAAAAATEVAQAAQARTDEETTKPNTVAMLATATVGPDGELLLGQQPSQQDAEVDVADTATGHADEHEGQPGLASKTAQLPAWKERMAVRQRFWSTSHGFKLGRKLGDWAAAEPVAPTTTDSGVPSSANGRGRKLATLESLRGAAATAGGVVAAVVGGALDRSPVKASQRLQLQLQQQLAGSGSRKMLGGSFTNVEIAGSSSGAGVVNLPSDDGECDSDVQEAIERSLGDALAAAVAATPNAQSEAAAGAADAEGEVDLVDVVDWEDAIQIAPGAAAAEGPMQHAVPVATQNVAAKPNTAAQAVQQHPQQRQQQGKKQVVNLPAFAPNKHSRLAAVINASSEHQLEQHPFVAVRQPAAVAALHRDLTAAAVTVGQVVGSSMDELRERHWPYDVMGAILPVSGPNTPAAIAAGSSVVSNLQEVPPTTAAAAVGANSDSKQQAPATSAASSTKQQAAEAGAEAAPVAASSAAPAFDFSFVQEPLLKPVNAPPAAVIAGRSRLQQQLQQSRTTARMVPDAGVTGQGPTQQQQHLQAAAVASTAQLQEQNPSSLQAVREPRQQAHQEVGLDDQEEQVEERQQPQQLQAPQQLKRVQFESPQQERQQQLPQQTQQQAQQQQPWQAQPPLQQSHHRIDQQLQAVAQRQPKSQQPLQQPHQSHRQILLPQKFQPQQAEQHGQQQLNLSQSQPVIPVDIDAELAALAYESAQLKSQVATASRNTATPTEDMILECQELLTLFGLPFIVAPTEAEAQCAWLEAAGLVDGVVTDDNDAFLFGSQHVYRHLFEDKKYVEEYHMSDIIAELGINREKLVCLAMLLGSDYTEGVAGIGVVNALEVVSAWPGGLAGLSMFRQWLEGPDEKLVAAAAAVDGRRQRQKQQQAGVAAGEEQQHTGARRRGKDTGKSGRGRNRARGKGKRSSRKQADSDDGGWQQASGTDIAAGDTGGREHASKTTAAGFANTTPEAADGASQQDAGHCHQQGGAVRKETKAQRQFKQTHKGVRRTWQLPHSFPSARVLEAYMKPLVDQNSARFNFAKPDSILLQQFCRERFGWDQAKVDDLLLPVLRSYGQRSSQMRIDQYLTHKQRFAKIRSKRLQQAVAKITGVEVNPDLFYAEVGHLPDLPKHGDDSEAADDGGQEAQGSQQQEHQQMGDEQPMVEANEQLTAEKAAPAGARQKQQSRFARGRGHGKAASDASTGKHNQSAKDILPTAVRAGSDGFDAADDMGSAASDLAFVRMVQAAE